jgi:hypothetical protein
MFSTTNPLASSSIPLPLALTKRWQYLVQTMCGLRAKKKQGVAGLGISQEKYGDPKRGGVQVQDGLEIAGTPIGSDEYVLDKLDDMVDEKVRLSYEAVGQIRKGQEQHLLQTQCCGNARVQHLWQVINPDLSKRARNQTDTLTLAAVKKTLGLSEYDDFQESSQQQVFLPQRFGGLGYRKAEDVVNSAFIGGFALAAFGDHKIYDIYPPLKDDIISPETSELPSMIALCSAWKEEILLTPRAKILAQAVAADALCPITQTEPGDDTPLNSPVIRVAERQDIQYELRWKMEHVMGSTLPEEVKSSTLNDQISERALENIVIMTNDNVWTNARQRMYDSPELFPSLLQKWIQQGGSKMQKLFGRLRDGWRYLQFYSILPDQKAQARFKGTLSAIAAEPLRALPNNIERTYATDTFQWFLCNRIQCQQPSARDIALQYCGCIPASRARYPILDGRHFRRCRYYNVMARIHDTIRDFFFMMVRAAGLTAVKEPLGLLPDNPDDKPADIYITGWKIPGIEETNHAMDFTCPLSESMWDSITLEVKKERATVVGAMGMDAENRKRDNVGTPTEQRARGNTSTMIVRCRDQNIHFWPVALEGDGVATNSLMSFFNNVCDAAHKLKDVNRSTFKAYFLSRLAHTLHQVSARLSLRQTAAARARLVYRKGPENDLADDIDLTQQLQTVVPAYISDRRKWRNRNSNMGIRLRTLLVE